MRYCDRCIQYGPDRDNPVKHDPEDCPEYGMENRLAYIDQWSRDNPPLDWNRVSQPGVDLTPSQQAKIKSVTNLTRSTGVIRKFFPERGYGFIKPDCGGYDVWIHRKFCVEGYDPQEGDRVIYLTRLGDRGLVAKEVEQLDTCGVDLGNEAWWKDENGEIHCTAEQLRGFLNEDIPDPTELDLGTRAKQSIYDVIYGKRS